MQIYRLKSASKPFSSSSNNYKFTHLVCVTPEKPEEMWSQRLADVPKEVKDAFFGKDWSDSPMPFVGEKSTFLNLVISRIDAQQLKDPLYIGRHGVYGFPYPPLDEFDEQHAYVLDRCA